MSESSLCKQSRFLKDHVLVIITSAMIYLKKGYAILQNVHSPRTLNLPVPQLFHSSRTIHNKSHGFLPLFAM